MGFVRRLESLIRPSDTPARFGGDEFAILLEDTDEPSAIAVAERILASLRASFRVAGQEVLMQASIGIATMDEGSTSDLLLRDADIAMCAAKTEGKSRYRLGTPELSRGGVRLLGASARARASRGARRARAAVPADRRPSIGADRGTRGARPLESPN